MWHISEALAKVVRSEVFARMPPQEGGTKFDNTKMRSPCNKKKYLYKNNTTYR